MKFRMDPRWVIWKEFWSEIMNVCELGESDGVFLGNFQLDPAGWFGSIFGQKFQMEPSSVMSTNLGWKF